MLILKDTTLNVIFYKYEILRQNVEINVIHVNTLRNAFANIIMKFIIVTKLNFAWANYKIYKSYLSQFIRHQEIKI